MIIVFQLVGSQFPTSTSLKCLTYTFAKIQIKFTHNNNWKPDNRSPPSPTRAALKQNVYQCYTDVKSGDWKSGNNLSVSESSQTQMAQNTTNIVWKHVLLRKVLKIILWIEHSVSFPDQIQFIPNAKILDSKKNRIFPLNVKCIYCNSKPNRFFKILLFNKFSIHLPSSNLVESEFHAHHHLCCTQNLDYKPVEVNYIKMSISSFKINQLIQNETNSCYSDSVSIIRSTNMDM